MAGGEFNLSLTGSLNEVAELDLDSFALAAHYHIHLQMGDTLGRQTCGPPSATGTSLMDSAAWAVRQADLT